MGYIKFEPRFLHPDEFPKEEDFKENFDTIKNNINFLCEKTEEISKDYNSFLNNIKEKTNSIRKKLNEEKERQEDINILCNKYSNFSKIITLTPKDLEGNIFFENNIMSASIENSEKVAINIINVNGNGFEGNKYVYVKNDFLDNSFKTDNRKSIHDNNLGTQYEYSRININSITKDYPIEFNKDDIFSQCVIEIAANKEINKFILYSDKNDLILDKIYTSSDGIMYNLDQEYNIPINEKYEKYKNPNYVFGSGVITFTPSKFIKIQLDSSKFTDEDIAFIDVMQDKKNNPIKKIKVAPTAKRSVIRINDLSAYKDRYQKSYCLSKELINTPIKSIALSVNSYICSNYNFNDFVKFYFIINGKEYEILPINNNNNGIKIIKYASEDYSTKNVLYLKENIKSAKLKIVISTPNMYTSPYLSDIKILIGGN